MPPCENARIAACATIGRSAGWYGIREKMCRPDANESKRGTHPIPPDGRVPTRQGSIAGRERSIMERDKGSGRPHKTLREGRPSTALQGWIFSRDNRVGEAKKKARPDALWVHLGGDASFLPSPGRAEASRQNITGCYTDAKEIKTSTGFNASVCGADPTAVQTTRPLTLLLSLASLKAPLQFGSRSNLNCS